MKNLILPLSFLLLSCSGTGNYLKLIGKLDKNEISGIEYIEQSNEWLWAIEDSGNKNKIYGLDQEGKTQHSVTIKNAKNVDWEDLTSDEEGNLYIGDFGNNDNARKDLGIYKVKNSDLKKKKASAEYKVSFYYPEQQKFPPKRSKRFYDVESFFEYGDNFYLFTKNRSAGFDGSFNVYKVPNSKGRHKAELIASLTSCDNYRKCAITAADISPDGKTVVLLSGQKIWLLRDTLEKGFNQDMMQEFDLGHYSQKEGICFKDNNTLLIADEKHKNKKPSLYELKISDLKSGL
ncbi:MAG: hypothetical protein BM557_04805 [Flavobacterium sp. MedPE-SWcel]|uniref:hypothetical protein n=1 Tax=uncultured Flavobacterium sp. TaxID=165435 RepID=UPI00091BC3CB|nr:hypothetical protein [uncultured Flavobacterium sp.]OIQ21079.1 MAG: hypothetical protein BM557_04805 [Flavobacterium sp. MedPE-SWcel]